MKGWVDVERMGCLSLTAHVSNTHPPGDTLTVILRHLSVYMYIINPLHASGSCDERMGRCWLYGMRVPRSPPSTRRDPDSDTPPPVGVHTYN